MWIYVSISQMLPTEFSIFPFLSCPFYPTQVALTTPKRKAGNGDSGDLEVPPSSSHPRKGWRGHGCKVFSLFSLLDMNKGIRAAGFRRSLGGTKGPAVWAVSFWLNARALSLSTRLGTCVPDIILLEDKTREILFHNEKLHLMAALVPHTLPDPSRLPRLLLDMARL